MVVLDTLRHVDDVDLLFEEEHVEFAEIAVDEASHVVDAMNDLDAVEIELTRLRLVDVGVLEERSGKALLANEAHDEHVAAQEDRLRTLDARLIDARQVAELLLGPCANHFARIVLGITVSESVMQHATCNNLDHRKRRKGRE